MRMTLSRSFLAAAACLGAILPAQAQNSLSASEKAQGFVLLFDGTLNSFKANFVDYVKQNTANTNLDARWKVDAAQKAMVNGGISNDIRSRKTYKDFDLRFDYRCDANQGVFYRFRVTHDRAWQTGVEFAINNHTMVNKDAPGAAYDLFAPAPNSYFLFSTGKWNQARIVVKGDSVEHWMNGVKVVGYKYHNQRFWNAYNMSKWSVSRTMTYNVPGNQAAGYIAEGYIGFQGDHGGKWAIRNLRIKPTNPKLGPPLAKEAASDAIAADISGKTGMNLGPAASNPWSMTVPAGADRRATVDGRLLAPSRR